MTQLRHVILFAAIALGLAACATETTPNLPPDALIVNQGDDQLSYRAPYDGMVYVWDATRNQIVYSGNLMRGQYLQVNARNNTITIDGTTAVERVLYYGDQYKVYFRQNEKSTPAATTQPTMP